MSDRDVRFRDATDLLGLPHGVLARELGVSVQTVRQARQEHTANSYRPPPVGWEAVVARYAREKGTALLSLAEQLEQPD